MERLTFGELGLSEPIMRAIANVGYEEATPIQTQAIPLIMSGRDVTGQSQTGTGKTAAFSIPAIERILSNHRRGTQVLILCPTRELAVQACDEIHKFTKYTEGIRAVAIYGGQPIERQFQLLKGGAEIVVGTPGRVMDHMRRHTLNLSNLDMIILDEADEMLSMGFIEDIETILEDVPDERQTILFSATLSREIMNITEEYQNEPEFIKVTPKMLTVENIDQYYYEIPHSHKIEALSRLMDVYHPELSMVFCNTKKQVDELVSSLQVLGYVAEGLHGDMKQAARDHVMNTFRKGKVDVLVATDVAARGIDIQGITAVFNYDIPQDQEYYVHRIGRTGRAGNTGKSFTFVTGSREMGELKAIMRYAHTEIKKGIIPTSSDVMASRIARFSSKVRTAVEEGDLEQYIGMVENLASEGISTTEIAAALLSFEMTSGGKTAIPSAEDDRAFSGFERRMNRRSDGKDSDRGERKGNRSRERNSNVPTTKIYIGIGKSAGIAAGHIVGAVANEAGVPGRSIGRVEIFDKYSTFDVPSDVCEHVINTLNKTRIMGRKAGARVFVDANNSSKDSGKKKRKKNEQY